ncbi:MAG: glycosyltransferase family 39 protein [Candidatus Dormibacteraeota bacterium]|nr:glycosyltransferase family 39 protein [Candidatus Dormibacteraeota bacterium]
MRAALRNPWLVAAAGLGIALAALYLAGIGSNPPGLYDDEASIGYNAWTIAHFGVDQYGNHVPLFFADFGDYKGPVATYLVAPLTWIMPSGATVVRVPSVLAGIAIFLIAARLAYVLTGSQLVALITMALTALQPWLFLQSHTMLEGNILMVLCILVACWCLAEAQRSTSNRWWTAAGVALALTVYCYSVGRLLAALVALAAVVAFHRAGRARMLRLLFPLAAAYVVLGAWALANPGALFQRFQNVGLFADNPSMLTAVGRFIGNYLSYFSPNFLLLHGDGNYRQTTGFGGVLLDATLPLILAGAVRLAMTWRRPWARFVFAGTLLAPVPAALTLAAPHALRGAGLLPFLLLFMIEGTEWLVQALRAKPALVAALAAVSVASAAPYFVDFFTVYPARAANAFEAGEAPALQRAYAIAQQGDHRLLLSASLNQPAMQLMYALLAPPPQNPFVATARLTVVSNAAQLAGASVGDVIVVGPSDTVPPGARLLFLVRDGQQHDAPVAPMGNDLLRVYVEGGA